MTVAFRVDASVEIGTGHVSRCLNLARALAKRGLASVFVTRAHEGHRNDWIESAGFPLLSLPKPASSFQPTGNLAHAFWLGAEQIDDAAVTAAVLAEIAPDWLVVDHYGIDSVWESAMRPTGARLLVIDDLADRQHDCDALIDQNAIASLGRNYSSLVPPHCIQLLGPSYALLATEYGALHAILPQREPPIRRAVVFFGGTDMHDLTLRTLRAIGQLPLHDIHFDILVTPYHQHRPTIERLAGSMANVTLHPPQPSLAPLFAAADLAIGAGGVSMWERCCLGLPSLVITVAENQVPGARAAHEARLVTWVGQHSAVNQGTIAAALRTALGAPNLALQSARGVAAVDGQGAERIAAMMTLKSNEKLNLRRAGRDDEARFLVWANDPITRAMSFSPGRISEDMHRNWFRGRLRALRSCRLFVAELDGGIALGQARFELRNGDWIIDYSLDPAFRGHGLGRPLLSAALDAMTQEFPGARFVGEVKRANPVSQRVFEALGFAAYPADDEFVRYSLDCSRGGQR